MGKMKVDFGTQIKQVRLKHKLTQEQFGEILGKSATTIHSYETNKITPPFDVLTTISSLFHITISDLMGLKSDVIPKIAEIYAMYLDLVGEDNE